MIVEERKQQTIEELKEEAISFLEESGVQLTQPPNESLQHKRMIDVFDVRKLDMKINHPISHSNIATKAYKMPKPENKDNEFGKFINKFN